MSFWTTGLALAGQAASAVMSAINNEKARKAQQAQTTRQEAHYEALANENPMARGDVQSALRQYDRSSKEQVETARNTDKITGATPEYSLGVQKGVSAGRADLMSNVTAQSAQRRDANEEKAEAARTQAANEEQAWRAARDQSFANLAANASQLVGAWIDQNPKAQEPKAQEPETQATLQSGIQVPELTKPKINGYRFSDKNYKSPVNDLRF